MKYIMAGLIIAATVIGFIGGTIMAPQKNATEQLTEIIDARRSVRAFASTPLSAETKANILWAAWGNNSTGTRTIPTAGNRQNMGLFAATAEGVFSFDGENITRVLDTDIRPLFSDNPGIRYAPLTLIFTGSDTRFSPMHAGSAYQNVSLYVTSRRASGLGDVVRIRVDIPGLTEVLPLGEDEFVIITQTIGYRP